MKSIEERIIDFKGTLIAFESIYSKEMLYGTPTELGFFEHWSQPNKSNTKFKMELEKTWVLHLRLKTWSRNNKSWYERQTKQSKSEQLNGLADFARGVLKGGYQ